MAALEQKDMTQEKLISAVKAQLEIGEDYGKEYDQLQVFECEGSCL